MDSSSEGIGKVGSSRVHYPVSKVKELHCSINDSEAGCEKGVRAAGDQSVSYQLSKHSG